MNREPIVEKMVIRDGFSYGKDLKICDVKLSKALIAIDEYCNQRSRNEMRKIWTCNLGLHRWDSWVITNESKCLECGITALEYKKQRGRLLEVKSIILHIKVNARRWRDEQLQRVKEIVDKEFERRQQAHEIHKGNQSM